MGCLTAFAYTGSSLRGGPEFGGLHCFGAPRSLYPGVRQPGLLESRNGRCSAQGTGRASLEDWAATATAGVHAATELSDHHRKGPR
jgi:hypothetical protein